MMFRVFVVAGPPIAFALALAFAVWYLENCDEWSVRQWFVDLAEAWRDPEERQMMLGGDGLSERLKRSRNDLTRLPATDGWVRQLLIDSKRSSPNHVPSTAFSEQQLARMQRVRLMTVSQLTSGLSVSDTLPRHRRVVPTHEGKSAG